jgi:hypothetical protein
VQKRSSGLRGDLQVAQAGATVDAGIHNPSIKRNRRRVWQRVEILFAYVQVLHGDHTPRSGA